MPHHLRAGAALHLIALSFLLFYGDAVQSTSSKNRLGICTAIQKKVTRQIIPTNETVNVRSVKIDPTFPFIHAVYRRVPVNRTLITVTRQKVLVCCEGWYRQGNKCKATCPFGCTHGSCVEPGKCHCSPGYTGQRCTSKCSQGYFGRNCVEKCSCENGAPCDNVTGRCRCPPGHFGTRCEKTCPPGTYGIFCLLRCRCKNGATCDPSTGRCSCPAGYRGSNCKKHCKKSTYGLGCANKCKCKNRSSCDHRTGKCLCRSGFTGEDCGTKCPAGTYGSNCIFKCNCQNGGECDVRNGHCRCPPGWMGEKCTSVCPVGSYGVSCASTCRCNATQICDRERGCTTAHVISLLPNDSSSSASWNSSRKNLVASFTMTLGVMLFVMFFVIGILVVTMTRFRRAFASRRLDESSSTISTDEKCVNLDAREGKIDYPKSQLHAETFGQNNPCYKG